MKAKYICIKNCKVTTYKVHIYEKGKVYNVRYFNKSRFYYIEHSVGEVSIDVDFLNENFILATDDTLLINELDTIFDEYFK